jgi:hypothetical protein
MDRNSVIYSDKELSRKIERTEARANADFVQTRARLFPDHRAEWIEVGGAYAMYDGAESPLTQTFGLGMFETASEEHLDRIESFFQERDAPVFHEISPLADSSILALLSNRGYVPIELTNVMYRLLDTGSLEPRRTTDITTRVIDHKESVLWARTSADGWVTEHESLADFMFNFGQISALCDGAFPYLAEQNDQPIAAGMLFIYDDVCMLAGAATVPSARNRGAQGALLAARLEHATASGCKLALMGAAPGSQSQINAQKAGFHIAYTRTKWHFAR